MHQIARSLAAAVALTLLVPSAAFAQAKPAPAATAKKAVKTTNEQRWTRDLASAATLVQEGVEIKRIDAKEKADIEAFMNKVRTQIASAKKNGISEAEEDQIEQLIADLIMGIANRYEDKAPAKAAVKK